VVVLVVAQTWSDLRTVTDLIALLSMLLSQFAVVRLLRVGGVDIPSCASGLVFTTSVGTVVERGICL
jgi:hypothetical protein